MATLPCSKFFLFGCLRPEMIEFLIIVTYFDDVWYLVHVRYLLINSSRYSDQREQSDLFGLRVTIQSVTMFSLNLSIHYAKM